jgi:hypothetical protein
VTITAIETSYAGCRFRSRLEARWAVFFDHLGIPWEYEPEGYLCSYRLTLDEGTFPYLPDFYLPTQQMWVEVKGSLNGPELVRLLDAAAHLSSAGSGGCHDDGGNDVVVLGQIPRGLDDRTPVRLHMHKGDLLATHWGIVQDNGSRCLRARHHVTIARDCGGGMPLEWDEWALSGSAATRSGEAAQGFVTDVLLRGLGRSPLAGDWAVTSAYTAARKARFEHGECG